jgi:pimeloyl-ACP methyl ester carboxylesterase
MKRIFLLLAVFALLVAGTASAAAGNQPNGDFTAEVVEFENDGGTIVGTFTMPDGVRGKSPAVLMLHGFTGDRNEGPVLQPDFSFTDFMYERTANVFAANGIASLRIDFRGSGESLDQFGFEDTTFSSQISDAYAAVEWLDDHRKVGDIGVLGLSQGGLVGTITAEAHKRVSSLVLWSPVANPVDTYKTVLGDEVLAVAPDGTVTYGGDAVLAGINQPSTDMVLPWGAPLTMNQAFFQELYTTDPIAAISHYDKPLQVVVGELDTIVTPQPEYGEFYMTYHDGYEELVVLDADHVFDVFNGNGAPALDDAIEESLDWFTETLRHSRW